MPIRSKFVLLSAALLMLALAISPLWAGYEFVLAASAARTAAGTGTSADVSRCREAIVVVRVTAGSGTVTTFKVFLEGSVDGSNFSQLGCLIACKDDGACTANTQNVVSETALVTTAEYSASCLMSIDEARAAWNIAGTTPSETFDVQMACK